MVHIILTILKLGAIILGIALAVVLFLLLLVLFVPVRYDVKAEREGEEMPKAAGKVHWLLHIVTYEVFYENGELRQILRVFGVPVWKD